MVGLSRGRRVGVATEFNPIDIAYQLTGAESGKIIQLKKRYALELDPIKTKRPLEIATIIIEKGYNKLEE